MESFARSTASTKAEYYASKIMDQVMSLEYHHFDHSFHTFIEEMKEDLYDDPALYESIIIEMKRIYIDKINALCLPFR